MSQNAVAKVSFQAMRQHYNSNNTICPAAHISPSWPPTGPMWRAHAHFTSAGAMWWAWEVKNMPSWGAMRWVLAEGRRSEGGVRWGASGDAGKITGAIGTQRQYPQHWDKGYGRLETDSTWSQSRIERIRITCEKLNLSTVFLVIYLQARKQNSMEAAVTREKN